MFHKLCFMSLWVIPAGSWHENVDNSLHLEVVRGLIEAAIGGWGASADCEGKRFHFHTDYRIRSFSVAPGAMGRVCTCVCVLDHQQETEGNYGFKPAGWNQLSQANSLKPVCVGFFFLLQCTSTSSRNLIIRIKKSMHF